MAFARCGSEARRGALLHGYSPETDQMLVVQDGGILVKGQDLRKWHENAALWGSWAE